MFQLIQTPVELVQNLHRQLSGRVVCARNENGTKLAEAPKWWRDIITLTFDLWGYRARRW